MSGDLGSGKVGVPVVGVGRMWVTLGLGLPWWEGPWSLEWLLVIEHLPCARAALSHPASVLNCVPDENVLAQGGDVVPCGLWPGGGRTGLGAWSQCLLLAGVPASVCRPPWGCGRGVCPVCTECRGWFGGEHRNLLCYSWRKASGSSYRKPSLMSALR